jgi:Raf kinase inhibitor-like YbhB/YbcL family protein
LKRKNSPKISVILRAAAAPVVMIATAVLGVILSCRSGASLAVTFATGNERNPSVSMTLSSPSFSSGGNIDKKFTCDGPDVSPQLTWTAPPNNTKSFALLVDDPDAPVGNWNHWVMWNIPESVHSLPEGVNKTAKLPDGSEQGMNDFHKLGYNGPCPPAGKPHRYYFKLFALDGKLNLNSGAAKRDLESAMKGHILAQAEWMGRYGR